MAARAVLENRSLKWSRPSAFNDIFDAQIDFDLNMDGDHIVEEALRRTWEIVQHPEGFEPGNALGLLLQFSAPRLREIGQAAYRAEFEPTLRQSVNDVKLKERFKADICELLSRQKILCFSDDPVSRPLWGHYGESFQGAALEFRTVPELDSPYKVARPVLYVPEAPRLVTELDLVAVLCGESQLQGLNAIDRFVFLKHHDWAWEKEWRLVSGEGHKPDDEVEFAHFSEKELASVLIGPRASAEFREAINAVVGERYPFTTVEVVTQGKNFALERKVIRTAQHEI